ncbi:TetR/AcrR family transcriptional regulator [Janthinobacterium sp.]|uniref:TetR/AcrR family transcriptional regulator n=1 Tax=Janthinobacterium sp. TaxID=1871054 RepID=UPI0026163C9C|nr:TetR/AcrR family transcriptional regulator [Janthinobacterium sp.]
MPHLPITGAQAPKRQRGHLRVAAIIEAGAGVFMEKGFEGATMTEIAARSGTAIGSLYRFFPSKEALADALLLQYTQHVISGLAELEQTVSGMAADGVADALVDFMLALQSQRSFAISLVEERGGREEGRLQFRAAMRDGMAAILRKALPGLTPAKSKVAAVVVLHILKGITTAGDEKPAMRRMLLAEIRELVRHYLVSTQP